MNKTLSLTNKIFYIKFVFYNTFVFSTPFFKAFYLKKLQRKKSKKKEKTVRVRKIEKKISLNKL